LTPVHQIWRGLGVQICAWPPSTKSSMPLMKLEALEARKTAAVAVSSGSATRPSGTVEAKVSSKVLLAARERFWSTGYSATTLDDVVVATGLGKGSLYGAFGDKHQLFLRVFDDYCVGVLDAVRRSLQGPDSGAYERLRSHVLAVATATANDTDRRGCLLAKGTAELGGHDEPVAARASQTIEDLEDLLAACIKQAQRQGDINPSADPDQLAGLLLAVLRGIEALGKAGKNRTSLTSIAEAALAALPRQ
jgi:TetR/AcrR family transcriptional repressor of nem operon